MTLTLLQILVLHWLVLLTPGPNVLLISQLAAGNSRRSALLASLGVCTVTLIWATLAVLGVGAVFEAHPRARLLVQVAGGLYLLYVAFKLWRSTPSAASGAPPRLGAAAAFRLGFFTNILNPKSALFFGSVFATSMPTAAPPWLLLAAVLLVLGNALVWHCFLAVAFSVRAVASAYTRQQGWLSRVAAAAVGAFGARLLWNTAREAP
jgi:threonine efflux protein